MVCARQEGALAYSSQEPCEERTITDPAFYLMRELRVRELTGLPGPTQGPHQFPTLLASRALGPGLSLLLPGLFSWDKEAAPRVCGRRTRATLWVGWTLLPGHGEQPSAQNWIPTCLPAVGSRNYPASLCLSFPVG